MSSPFGIMLNALMYGLFILSIFLMLCGYLGEDGHLKRIFKPWSRLAISSILATMIVFGLFLWLALWYDDIMPQDADYPPSKVENTFAGLCNVALWPLWLLEMTLGHDPDEEMLPVLVGTGLSWGLVTELIFILTTRRKSTEALKSK